MKSGRRTRKNPCKDKASEKDKDKKPKRPIKKMSRRDVKNKLSNPEDNWEELMDD